MSESHQEAYDRGAAAGEISARLAGHDQHFAKINGSIEKVAVEMHALTLGMQRLADQAEANAKTVITTAAALKDAEEARRSKSEQAWTPLARTYLILGIAGTLVALVAAVIVVIKP